MGSGSGIGGGPGAGPGVGGTGGSGEGESGVGPGSGGMAVGMIVRSSYRRFCSNQAIVRRHPSSAASALKDSRTSQ